MSPVTRKSIVREGGARTEIVCVHRAEDVPGSDPVPVAIIVVSRRISSAYGAVDSPGSSEPRGEDDKAADARAIASALRASLPGGTLGHLTVELLRTQIGRLSVPEPASAPRDQGYADAIRAAFLAGCREFGSQAADADASPRESAADRYASSVCGSIGASGVTDPAVR